MQATPSPDTARNTVNGIPTSAVWRTTAQAQTAIDKLASAVEMRFGSADNDPRQPLRNGYVGTAINDDVHTFTVVVDFDDDKRAELERELQRAVGDAIDVRVGVSCHPASDLADALDTVTSPEFMGGSTRAAWSGELSPYDSRIHMNLHDPDNATAESMRGVSPDLIQVTERPDPFRRLAGTDRGHDVQPHWGGARIGLVGVAENVCSSGFAIDTAMSYSRFPSTTSLSSMTRTRTTTTTST